MMDHNNPTQEDETSGNRIWEDGPPEGWVRDAAYYMWEQEGQPSGRDQEYWYRARGAWLDQQALDQQDLDQQTQGQQNQGQEAGDAATQPDPEMVDRAVEISRKIGLQRPFHKDSDDSISGGFNQKR